MAGKKANTTNMYNWRAMALIPVLPYFFMLFGVLGTLLIAWALRLWINGRVPMYGFVTMLIMLSAGILSIAAYKFYVRLTPRNGSAGPNWLLWQHIVFTLGSSHVCIMLFVWFGSREMTWVSWCMGSVFIIISWMLRRFARSTTEQWGEDNGAAVGLPGGDFLD